MTLVSDIITDAFRQGNLIAVGTTATAAQTTEALRYLQRIVKSVFGQEMGDVLTTFPIGKVDISRPSGYPWWNTVPDNDWFVPKNTRLMFNLDESVPIYLHPDPDDGSRFAVIDVAESFTANPITVYGNGRLIETTTSISLATNGLDREWFYRADLGGWLRVSPLASPDTFPFPEEFDDFFITMLAMRINPAYGIELDGQSQSMLQRSRTQLRSRYTQNIPVRSELGLIRMPRVSQDRDSWGNSYWLYNPNSMFDKGWPW